jgi:hypothetical protein
VSCPYSTCRFVKTDCDWDEVEPDTGNDEVLGAADDSGPQGGPRTYLVQDGEDDLFFVRSRSYPSSGSLFSGASVPRSENAFK